MSTGNLSATSRVTGCNWCISLIQTASVDRGSKPHILHGMNRCDRSARAPLRWNGHHTWTIWFNDSWDFVTFENPKMVLNRNEIQVLQMALLSFPAVPGCQSVARVPPFCSSHFNSSGRTQSNFASILLILTLQRLVQIDHLYSANLC
jgi:hypothetical protein